MCVVERSSGFDIVKNSIKEKKRQEFKPINIVFQPLKHYKQVINCYFSDMLHFIYIEQHILKKTNLKTQTHTNVLCFLTVLLKKDIKSYKTLY